MANIVRENRRKIPIYWKSKCIIKTEIWKCINIAVWVFCLSSMFNKTFFMILFKRFTFVTFVVCFISECNISNRFMYKSQSRTWQDVWRILLFGLPFMCIFNVYLCSSCSQSNLVWDFNFENWQPETRNWGPTLAIQCPLVDKWEFLLRCIKMRPTAIQINKTACMYAPEHHQYVPSVKKGLWKKI